MKKTKKQNFPRLMAQRGQAMISYALISSVLLIGGTVLVGKIIPDLIKGMDQFARSLYMGLNLPFP